MCHSGIQKILACSSIINEAIRKIETEKHLCIRGLSGSLKALFLSLLMEKTRMPIIYVSGDDNQEEIIKEDLEAILDSEKVAFFPKIREIADSEIYYDSDKKSRVQSGLEKLVEKEVVIAIISPKNLVHKFPNPKRTIKKKLFLQVNAEYDFERLKLQLADMGFDREHTVENWSEISIRGGIIDVFPLSCENPIRIEFAGNQIESMRIFDPTTQRSIKNINQITLFPQQVIEADPLQPTESVSIFEYFEKDAIIFFDEIEIIQKEIEDFFLPYKIDLEDNVVSATEQIEQKARFLSWKDIQSLTARFSIINHDSIRLSKNERCLDFSSQMQDSFQGSFSLLKKKINFYYRQKLATNKSFQIFFLCESSEQIRRMEELFMEAGIDLRQVKFEKFGLNQGFIFKDANLVVFTDNHFFGRPIRWRRRKKISRGLTIHQMNSLSIGDFVVHVDKGIGKYDGLKKILVHGHERECLSMIYRDSDILYVPLERMDRVQKYSAKDGVVPSLSKLGSKNWERLKNRTKKHVKELTRELTVLYANRKAQQGFAFSSDTLWQRELEASFEFEDTADQAKVTQEIKTDMELNIPMDRLVCGDVGYGKTEVAIRAAFKAANDGKQVAVLVPTTILALQHCNVFRERLRNYPVSIDLLSRFRTRAEQKNVIERIGQGRIDIIVGTHRMLSKDVQFKDLGLLIIDEEHRFGVQKKESLKKQYPNVDVLSMSATPIPRTLNMALLGIRDMSMIATAPKDRHPIITEVTPFNVDLIRMAILKEVERGGQVFFVHNRVQSIESVANMLKKNIPEVSFAIAHGQMEERQLEKVMWDFAIKKFQCLVSTMIIESGLDIPNVNTLIISRADRFGLSQLYQLRGRVGRANQIAYAYLLVPPISHLTKSALQRLRFIEEFSELGAGFNIAMRDLEMRGAGNVLGAEQSGHIAALGYELYMKIIEEAAQELKFEQEGKPIPDIEKDEIKVELNVDAFLPDDYVDPSELKVDIYRRLANESNILKIKDIKEELKDRFGSLPEAAENLFNLVELKLLGRQLEFKTIRIDKNKLIAYFSDKVTETNNAELMEKKVSSIIDKAKREFHFLQDRKKGFGLVLNIPMSEQTPIEYVKNFLKKLL